METCKVPSNTVNFLYFLINAPKVQTLTLALSRPAGEGTRRCLRKNCGDLGGGVGVLCFALGSRVRGNDGGLRE